MRKLILIAVLVTAAVAGGAAYVIAGGDGDDARRTGAIRSYSTGKLALQADGVNLGLLKSASCGAVSAEVTRNATLDTTALDPKQIGPARYEPCELQFALAGMGQPLHSWISNALAGKVGPMNLTISYLDSSYVEKSKLELEEAAPVKLELPALDAGGNAYVYTTLTVAPRAVHAAPGSGATVQGTSTAAKQQLSSAFRFEWSGAPLATVSKVSGVTVNFDPETLQPKLGEIDFTMSENDPRMAAVDSSFRKFVIDGVNGDKSQTTANIVFLQSNLSTVSATVSLKGVGWAAGELVGATSADTAVAKRRYTLYTEGATLVVS